ncbi:MAG: sensor domain-containing diguanylate cyclase [Myxococcota bacterium]
MLTDEASFRVLLDLVRRLNGTPPSLEASLQLVTDAALALLEGQHASIRLLDASGNELLCGARSGEGTEERPVTFRRGEGVAGWVVEHGELARIPDVREDPRFKRLAQTFAIRSMLAIPLLSRGEVIGCFAVTSEHPGHFDDDAELVGQVLASCAVPPIERQRLERLAITDAHTAAYNQGYFFPRLREEMRRAREDVHPLALLLMDLDHFKSVNDAHGHDVGDEVLLLFADRVREDVRRDDVFIRRGGEEFVLILPGATMAQAAGAAERIRARMAAEPCAVGELALDQRVSIGAALWDGTEDADAFARRADAAMYAAKEAGRDRVVVDG